MPVQPLHPQILRLDRAGILQICTLALLASCAGCEGFAVERLDREGAQHDPFFPLMTRNIQFGNVDDAKLRRIFPDLKRVKPDSLEVYGPMTDASMSLLSRLPSLESLYLYDVRATLEGFRKLHALPKLKLLRLGAIPETQADQIRRELPDVRVEVWPKA